ncbi:hypothetical protein KFL_003140010 [Klebsormidium nitens]|uniref:Tim44-like domain-containing protein n=1 Tax=Klebsormidium nitens TaxID=105231 RepID=A0A1Y1IA39_KLENI|nr:hypothetical protein KFL_003140010 [Klebsormidium nitens]|eukprot:GAQ86822.1 hypothetical protein KFL_003140010 [Klebsormidium nitens]
MPPARRIFQSIGRQGKLLDAAWWKGTQVPVIAESFGGVSDSGAPLRWPLSTHSCEAAQLPKVFFTSAPQVVHQEGRFGFAEAPPRSGAVVQRNFSGSTSGSVDERGGAGGGSDALRGDAAATQPLEAVQAESSTGGALSGDAPQTAEHSSADSKGAEEASETRGAEAADLAADATSTSGSVSESAIGSLSAKREEAEVKEGPGDQAIGASVASGSSSKEQQPDAGASQVGTSEKGLKKEADGSSGGGRPPNEGEEAEATEVLTRPEPNILSYVADLFAEARVALTMMALKRGIERGFDLDDFKRGAEVAFRAFMEYYPKGDFQTLRNMVSPTLLKHLQDVWDEFKEQGKVMECTLEDLQGVQVTEMDIYMRSPPFCDGVPPVEGYDANKWLAVSVRFDSTENYRMRGPEGKLLSSCIDKRGHVLKFVRQLPRFDKVPMDELESPWYIVNI